MESFELNWNNTEESEDENGAHTITWASNPDHEEVSKLYFARCKELSDAAEKRLCTTMALLGKYFYQLWD